MNTNDPDRLAPPPSTRQTSTTMQKAESSQSSPSSRNSPLATTTRKLEDASDPLSFLMDSVAADMLSGSESSADDSFTSLSTSPSVRDSPTVDWATNEGAKDTLPDLWAQTDFSGLSFDAPGSVDMMNFDPATFNMPLTLEYLLSNPMVMDSSNIPSNDATFPFSFQANDIPGLTASSGDGSDLQQSDSSSSAASVSSVSPAAEPVKLQPTPPAPDAEGFNDQSVEELARKALQAVGVYTVLPAGANQQYPGKLPIPRLHSSSAPKSGKQPTVFVQPPTPSTTSSSTSTSPAPTAAPATRTKTSHTTIERRYRTNINSRIQGLRAAVPALRVLEHKPGNRVGNLPLKPGTRRAGIDVAPGAAADGADDVIDERGFIDGVKVARKGSKANVLAKATEYIRVLKRREYRLKREQDGLKALVRSLVGGDDLVREWETMWREKFGGPETDEIQGEDGEADDENDDDDEDEEGEELAGKKRKRPKTEKKATSETSPTIPSQNVGSTVSPIPGQPEKRKRGRPRKVPLPPVSVPANLVQNPFVVQQAQQMPQMPMATLQSLMDVDRAVSQLPQQPIVGQQQTSQPAQYLLAAFAFFSFFNSPLSYSSSWTKSQQSNGHDNTHTGVVLGDTLPHNAKASGVAFSWRDAIQLIHLAVSLLLFVSIIVPWLPRVARTRIARLVPSSLRPILGSAFLTSGLHSRSRSSSEASSTSSDDEKVDVPARLALLEALRPDRSRPAAEEVQALCEALGLHTGLLGLFSSVVRQLRACMSMRSRSRLGLERRMLEQRAVLRLAELVALDASASMTTRIQTYLYAHRFLSVFSASPADISTLALVVQPLWRAKAASLWALAAQRAQSSEGQMSPGLVSGARFNTPHVAHAYEAYVLNSMSVDDAASTIAAGLDTVGYDTEHGTENDARNALSPLCLLARHTVRAVVRRYAEAAFLRVAGDGPEMNEDADDVEARKDDLRRVVAAARTLDLETASIANTYERVCALGYDTLVGVEGEKDDATPEVTAADKELYALLQAVVLCRSLRLFPAPAPAPLAGAGVGKAPLSRPPPPAASPVPEGESDASIPSDKDREKCHEDALRLRRALASAAFDRSERLEDARDRVSDMLFALAVAERERKAGGSAGLRAGGRFVLRAS